VKVEAVARQEMAEPVVLAAHRRWWRAVLLKVEMAGRAELAARRLGTQETADAAEVLL